MKTAEDKLDEIKAALKTGSCMYGTFEHCEVCSSVSQFNRLRDRITEIIDGPKPPMTLADYGRIVKIDLND